MKLLVLKCTFKKIHKSDSYFRYLSILQIPSPALLTYKYGNLFWCSPYDQTRLKSHIIAILCFLFVLFQLQIEYDLCCSSSSSSNKEIEFGIVSKGTNSEIRRLSSSRPDKIENHLGNFGQVTLFQL